MNKKGFTLIELLAVIVILAIIALIATPIVLNIIEDSKKSAFVQTGNGIIDAAKYYYMNEMLDGAKPTENKVFIFNGSTNSLEGLGFDGEIPKNGSVIINTEGKVAIGVTDGRYCVIKDFDAHDVTILKDVEACKNPGEPEPIITSEHHCVMSGICSEEDILAGIKVNVKVNKDENYNFYVLNDIGGELTLIMDRNLYSDLDDNNGNIEWINEGDYTSAGGSDWRWISGERYQYGNNEKGPITALKELQKRTKNWTNLTEMIISTFDDEEGNEYNLMTSYKMYARLPKYSELIKFMNEDVGGVPATSGFLHMNMYQTGDDNTEGYWLSTIVGKRFALHMNAGNTLSFSSSVTYGAVVSSCNYYGNGFNYIYGLRPVITVSKGS